MNWRVREQAAGRLHQAILRQELPPAAKGQPVDVVPASLPGVLMFITRRILFDGDLPARWRFFLWYWFIGRQLAARGWLGPLVK